MAEPAPVLLNRLLILQRGLNLKEILYNFINVDSLCLQLSVRNLIAESVVPHNLGPGATSSRTLIEHESRFDPQI